MQLQTPDDGRGGARNMLSDTKRQAINLRICCIWLVNLFESYDDARTCQCQTVCCSLQPSKLLSMLRCSQSFGAYCTDFVS
jgi:hypothetical protein